MQCPYCGASDTKVLETRTNTRASVVRRRRACGACGERFYTTEQLDTAPLTVINRRGVRTDFDRKTLVDSLALAGKSSLPEEAREEVADRSIAKLVQKGPLVTSAEIAEATLASLDANDLITYTRYLIAHTAPNSVQDVLTRVKRDASGTSTTAPDEMLNVIKRSGDTEPFDKQKLHRSLLYATRGRPGIGAVDIQAITEEVEQTLRAANKEKLTTEHIADLVLDVLRTRDPLAYIAYACVAKQLDNYAKLRLAVATITDSDKP